jgi:3-phenylpropionate/cinnamic acid dioxygenase small subunit
MGAAHDRSDQAMTITLSEARALLFREARLLDTEDWDSWLDLYADDCEFWMPAWRDERRLTIDPQRELSLIYYSGRQNLVDRVWRARSGQSVASLPAPRVVHIISNVELLEEGEAKALIASNFVVHLFDKRANRTHQFFGRYEHRLAGSGIETRISSKKIILLNDTIPTVLDFFYI